jgi:putative ABC transport system substrate-binding protein
MVGEAAKEFERGKVSLLYAFPTSVATAAKRATTQIPIVFAAGSDPVARGLVESFPRPGGRVTGVYYWTTDLTAKRLEVLKDILPKLRRVVTFYDPKNLNAQESAKAAREAGRRLGIQIVERHVNSPGELQAGLRALKPGEADAFFHVSDAMVTGQAQLIIEVANAKGLPTMFHDSVLVAQGGLVSYGENFREIGRMSAKYVQRILAGTNPRDLPVEQVHRLGFVINLKTARALGLTIPRSVLSVADEVIQ